MASQKLPLRRITALADISSDFDVLFCDVWGVLHNGLTAWQDASIALREYRQTGKMVVLISNSPRPAVGVGEQLDKLGVSRAAFDAIVTSGDATAAVFADQYRDKRVTHVGPEKDRPLLDALPVTFTDDGDAEVCLCSGLVDDLTETPEDYRSRLETLADRSIPMVCANPDKVVEMGDRLIYCAGALADLYAELGGETIILGKPHAPIYDMAFAQARNHDRDRVLVVGDAVRTDLQGAVAQRLKCLFITGGIHAGELGPTMQPNPVRVEELLDPFRDSIMGWMPRLA
ncbi:MAG: TIGR01459 family HAD-type hydrolase [Pseudomonadota bacterium]